MIDANKEIELRNIVQEWVGGICGTDGRCEASGDK